MNTWHTYGPPSRAMKAVIPAATTHNSHAHHSQLCSHSSQPWLCPLPYLHHIRDVTNGELIAWHGLWGGSRGPVVGEGQTWGTHREVYQSSCPRDRGGGQLLATPTHHEQLAGHTPCLPAQLAWQCPAHPHYSLEESPDTAPQMSCHPLLRVWQEGKSQTVSTSWTSSSFPTSGTEWRRQTCSCLHRLPLPAQDKVSC